MRSTEKKATKNKEREIVGIGECKENWNETPNKISLHITH